MHDATLADDCFKTAPGRHPDRHQDRKPERAGAAG
jgi:hypothetical protein